MPTTLTLNSGNKSNIYSGSGDDIIDFDDLDDAGSSDDETDNDVVFDDSSLFLINDEDDAASTGKTVVNFDTFELELADEDEVKDEDDDFSLIDLDDNGDAVTLLSASSTENALGVSTEDLLKQVNDDGFTNVDFIL